MSFVIWGVIDYLVVNYQVTVSRNFSRYLCEIETDFNGGKEVMLSVLQICLGQRRNDAPATPATPGGAPSSGGAKSS